MVFQYNNFRFYQNNMEEELINDLLEKVTRFEVINHAKNDKAVGRLLTLYKELNNFKNIQLSLQDNNQTLKIFID